MRPGKARRSARPTPSGAPSAGDVRRTVTGDACSMDTTSAYACSMSSRTTRTVLGNRVPNTYPNGASPPHLGDAANGCIRSVRVCTPRAAAARFPSPGQGACVRTRTASLKW